MASPSAAKLAGLKAVLKRLQRPDFRVPPKPEGFNALERILALILQAPGTWAAGEQAVKVLKRRFAHWNEVRVARQYEVREALQKGRVGNAEARANLAQEFLRRVFGLQNHLELDWVYDATSERRQKLLNALMMSTDHVGPVLDLDATEEEGPLVTTDARRLLSRLGLVPANPKDSQVRELLDAEITARTRNAKTIALEVHAQTICNSKHPHCRQCALLDLCPHGRRTLGAATYKAALAELGLPKASRPRSGTVRAKTAKRHGTTRRATTRR